MDKRSWNEFVRTHGPRSGAFLQSWEWGEFQKQVGETVNRQAFEEEEEIIGVAQWLERSLPLFGSYAFCPKGPIGAWQPTVTDKTFLRVEPMDSDLPTYAHKTIDLNPAHTIITDLTQNEEELLKVMHHKTRYNIRLAQKKGVEVRLTEGNFEEVWKLFEQTSSRGEFRLHRRDYYKQMLESLRVGECRAFLATAVHEGVLLAANIMIDFGKTRTYLHGASSNEHRNLMGPYLLHWELLRDAKAKGFLFYDWWGVAPAEIPSQPTTYNLQPPHPWAGISRFKRGYGGEEIATPGTHDLILKPWNYHFYQLARKIRRLV